MSIEELFRRCFMMMGPAQKRHSVCLPRDAEWAREKQQ